MSVAPPCPDYRRLLSALFLGGEPDRVPLADMFVDARVKSAVLGRPIYSLQDEVEFWATAGYDYVPIPVGLVTQFGPARPEPHPPISAWPAAEDFDYDPLEEVLKSLPPGMAVVAVIGYVFTPVLQWAGFEGLSRHNDGTLADAYEKVGGTQYGVLDTVTKLAHVVAVWNPDDIAYSRGLMVSPQHLRKHVFPWYKRMAALCRERGKAFIFHSDGDISSVLDDMVEIGANAIHPLEPGAMELAQLKRDYGTKLCLMGGIDPVVLSQGSPQQVELEVRQKIKGLAPGGGYCLGAGGDVYAANIRNYDVMRQALFKYGRYPVRP